jgi:hypothetical protein
MLGFGLDEGDGKDTIDSCHQSSSVTRDEGIPEEVNQAFRPIIMVLRLDT